MEIMVPGGLERYGDGWKLSARIRIVHARIRHLLDGSDEWDTEAWGVPLSAAHLGYAITVFSQRLLVHSNTLGAPFNKEEWDSFLKLWRYTGYVMGIPESILYKNEEESLRIQKITHMLEPEIGHESIVMANQLIENAVLMSGADADVREETRRTAHKLSRCLIGNEMADALGLPKTRTFAVLPYFRATEFSRRLFSNSLAKFNNFSRLMNLSVYDNIGITYELPDHVKHKHSGQW